jgi:hypothetical protein
MSANVLKQEVPKPQNAVFTGKAKIMPAGFFHPDTALISSF